MVDNPFLIANHSLQTGIGSWALIENYFKLHEERAQRVTQRMNSLRLNVNQLKLQLEDEVNLLEQRMTGKLQIEEAHSTAMMENIGKLNKRIDKLKRKLEIEKMYRKKMQADRGDMVTDTDDSDDEQNQQKAEYI